MRKCVKLEETMVHVMHSNFFQFRGEFPLVCNLARHCIEVIDVSEHTDRLQGRQWKILPCSHRDVVKELVEPLLLFLVPERCLHTI